MASAIQDTLRDAKLSITKPRITILKRLSDVHEPIEMSRLLTLCPEVDRATVYRTIDTLEKHGIIKKVQIGWKYKLELGDNMHAHHHHMSCIACGKITDFHESEIMVKEFEKLQSKHKFRASSHNLELTGLCETCQK